MRFLLGLIFIGSVCLAGTPPPTQLNQLGGVLSTAKGGTGATNLPTTRVPFANGSSLDTASEFTWDNTLKILRSQNVYTFGDLVKHEITTSVYWTTFQGPSWLADSDAWAAQYGGSGHGFIFGSTDTALDQHSNDVGLQTGNNTNPNASQGSGDTGTVWIHSGGVDANSSAIPGGIVIAQGTGNGNSLSGGHGIIMTTRSGDSAAPPENSSIQLKTDWGGDIVLDANGPNGSGNLFLFGNFTFTPTPGAAFNINNAELTNVPVPTNPTSGVPKSYVDAVDAKTFTPAYMLRHGSSTVITGSLTTVDFTTQDWASGSDYSAGDFTCPSSGMYAVDAALTLNAAFSGGTDVVMEIQVSTHSYIDVRDTPSGVSRYTFHRSVTLKCNQGQSIAVQVECQHGLSCTFEPDATETYLSIAKTSKE